MGAITDNRDAHDVCRAIREIRLEKDISQQEVAEALGLQQAYVSAWERFRVPTVDQIWDIEDVLKVAHGTILRRAGYIEQMDSMRLDHHIKLDDELSRESKRLLLEFLAFRQQVDGVADVPAKRPTRPRKAK